MNKVFNDKDQWVGVKVTSKQDGDFTVPVVDARRSENQRAIASEIKRQNNFSKGSRFMHPSYSVIGKSYQVSHKK